MRECITNVLTHCNKDFTLYIAHTNTLITKLLILMTPNKETKFGVTFGQIYLILGLIITTTISIGTAWTNINTRLTALETSKTSMQLQMETERNDNKEEHTLIVSKLDRNNETLNLLIGAINHQSKVNKD